MQYKCIILIRCVCVCVCVCVYLQGLVCSQEFPGQSNSFPSCYFWHVSNSWDLVRKNNNLQRCIEWETRTLLFPIPFETLKNIFNM